VGKLLALSIDVMKIDKKKLFVGKKGTYLKLTISLNDEIDQFGNNVSVWEEQSAEDRKAKVTRNFLGNGKVIFDSATGAGNNQHQQQSNGLPVEEDDMPF
jgi:hypothetical protein